ASRKATFASKSKPKLRSVASAGHKISLLRQSISRRPSPLGSAARRSTFPADCSNSFIFSMLRPKCQAPGYPRADGQLDLPRRPLPAKDLRRFWGRVPKISRTSASLRGDVAKSTDMCDDEVRCCNVRKSIDASPDWKTSLIDSSFSET